MKAGVLTARGDEGIWSTVFGVPLLVGVLCLRLGVVEFKGSTIEDLRDLDHQGSSNGRAILAMLAPSEVVGLEADRTGVWLHKAERDLRLEERVGNA